MKLVLRQVGVLSTAKLQAVIMGVMGVFIGIIYAILAFVGGFSTGSVWLGLLFAILAFIASIAAYALMGFVFGALGAWLYNVFAEKIGGIEMTFEKK